MKNLKQIETLKKVFQQQRVQIVGEFVRVDTMINKKITTVSKMIMYQKEYAKDTYLQTSRAIPCLHKNLQEFEKKIQRIIEQEEQEIKRLMGAREAIKKRLEEIDHKIDLMKNFEKKARHVIFLMNEKKEQRFMDDLSVLKKIGNHYD